MNFDKFSREQIQGYLLMKMKDKYFLSILFEELKDKGGYSAKEIKQLTNEQITDFIYQRKNLSDIVKQSYDAKDNEENEKRLGFDKESKTSISGLYLSIRILEYHNILEEVEEKGLHNQLQIVMCFMDLREKTIPCKFKEKVTDIMQVSFFTPNFELDVYP